MVLTLKALKETYVDSSSAESSVSQYGKTPLLATPYIIQEFDLHSLRKKINKIQYKSGELGANAYANVHSDDTDNIEIITYNNHVDYIGPYTGITSGTSSNIVLDFIPKNQDRFLNIVIVRANYPYTPSLNIGVSELEVDCEDVIPTATDLYPNEIIANRDKNLIVSWTYYNDLSIGQKKYEIDWSSNGGTTWHSVSSISANNYHEFTANTFPNGNIKYRVRVTDNEDHVSEWIYAEFEVVGTPDVPIPNMSDARNSQFPRMTWDGPFQRAYEAQILTQDKKTLLKTSGVVMDNTDEYEGKGYNRFTDYIVPDNTVLVARVKFLNKYGNWSDWGETSFRIRGHSVPAYPPTDIIAQVNRLSVDTRCTPNESGHTKYTYITKNGEMVCKYDGSFIKDYPELNTDVTYSAITIEDSYLTSKGDDVVIRIDYDGIVIHNPNDINDYIAIDKAEDLLYVNESDTIDYSLNRLLGKNYPVRDQTIWKTSTRTVTCHVSDAEYNKLKQWSQIQSGVFFRGTEAAWYASMDIVDNGKYIGGGRNVTLTFTRIYKHERRNWIED